MSPFLSLSLSPHTHTHTCRAMATTTPYMVRSLAKSGKLTFHSSHRLMHACLPSIHSKHIIHIIYFFHSLSMVWCMLTLITTQTPHKPKRYQLKYAHIYTIWDISIGSSVYHSGTRRTNVQYIQNSWQSETQAASSGSQSHSVRHNPERTITQGTLDIKVPISIAVVVVVLLSMSMLMDHRKPNQGRTCQEN